jgi:hypothetical protein
MSLRKRLCRGALVVAVAALAALPASATTLVRQSLEKLVASHSRIVLGKVLEAHSYWNQEGTFILTDVRFASRQVIKGSPEDGELTVTLLGGQVGDLTTVIVGGAELVPGRSYLLFLNEQNLPGAKSALTVREHVQGAFDIQPGQGGERAVSQAVHHPLLPDKEGFVEPPGGAAGLELSAMIRSIRAITTRQGSHPEVK